MTKSLFLDSANYCVENAIERINEYISKNNLKQLRIAETEKYAHVTFFFNGGEEKQYKGEDRILVPSPKVETYDMQPEMSAVEVTDKVVEAIKRAVEKQYNREVTEYENYLAKLQAEREKAEAEAAAAAAKEAAKKELSSATNNAEVK